MSVNIVDKIGDVKIYGTGYLGGKGNGLVKINECKIPRAHKLKTRVLATTFYDHYLRNNKQFSKDELDTIKQILQKLGDIPISVRSSATNEAWADPSSKDSVHAGENTSFMLPNNHPDFSTRFNQLVQSIYYIYNDFFKRQPENSQEKMAIVINPIPGFYDKTMVGPVYYPLISGVANSCFPYALKTQKPEDGFARIAFGHGYATVLDDFPVISMATIKDPIPFDLIGKGQSYFYAIDMTKNESLKGHELETMKKLHTRFSTAPFIPSIGKNKSYITFKKLVENDLCEFKSGLSEIMDLIAEKISTHFQIEFIFNFSKENGDLTGRFHIVQLTQLPELKYEKIEMPDNVDHTYLSIKSLQGHGVKHNLRKAIVVSPFIYSKEMHHSVVKKIHEYNQQMKQNNESYMLIVPGRLGSKNRDWGIQIEYEHVDYAAAIFEYGVDIAGRPEPVQENSNLTGGIYGSHFLYMIQGGDNEEQKQLQTRIYGTQGTHFLTNLIGNNVIYGYIAPTEDKIDPWFFAPSNGQEAIYVLDFQKDISIYADSLNQRCLVVSQN